METIFPFDLRALITTVGYLGLFAIIFAESGLFIGFFLPGDSLLFTAGFLASQGFFHIVPLVVLCVIAAVLGDNVGYAFGKRVGPRIFKREDSIIFHKKHLAAAEEFYKKYGGKAVVLARFMPVVRTFAPILAGVGNMQYSTFFFYNIAGGLLWGAGITLGGYYLGSVVPDPDKYLLPLIVAIIVISFLPPIIHVLRTKEDREKIYSFFRRLM